MGRPLVSVVIPVYNGERHIASALQSVFDQDYHPVEVIVVNDGSVDRSADIVCSYKEIKYIFQANQGPAVARNVGIEAARGELVSFLDQDDLWAGQKLSIQVDYLLAHPFVGYVLAGERLFLEPGTQRPAWLREELLLKDHTGFLPGTLVVRIAMFERIGLFDPKYRNSSDLDWLKRARDAGISAGILPDVLLYKRIHSSNQSREQRGRFELFEVIKASLDRQRNRREHGTSLRMFNKQWD